MAGINQIEFDQIFMDCYKQIRNFLYYKTGNMQLAEDLTQDTFVRIWEKREKIILQSVKPLLFKIANNLFLNKIEHEKVLLKFETAYQVNSFTEGPDFELEMKEFDMRLQMSLNKMDEKNRTVFFEQDWGQGQIAHVSLLLSVEPGVRVLYPDAYFLFCF